jgi:hypothetical protein
MHGFLAFLSRADWLDAARIRRIALIFGVLALGATGADAWLHTRAGLTDAQGVQLGRDFVNYWAGAHLAAEGHAAGVYDIDGFLKIQHAHTAANAQFKWYSYPPTTLLLTLPLALMDFVSALVVWLLAGILAFAALLARALGRRWGLLAAFATPASFMNAISGQNGQFSAVLLGGGIAFLERRPWLAGMLIGLLCYKPHLAILVPFALAAGGYWRSFAAAAATAAVLIAASFFQFGPQTWQAFLHNAPLNALLMEYGVNFWHRMPTMFAAARLAGLGIGAAWAIQAVSALVVCGLTIKVWRSGASVERKGAVLILATFLATPYAWDYDLVILTLAVVWLAAEAARRGFQPWEKIALAATIIAPLIFSPLGEATHIQIGPLVMGWLLWLAARPVLARRSSFSDAMLEAQA